MTHAYFNDPNSRVTLHRGPACSEVAKMEKPGQRRVRFDRTTIGEELGRFATKAHAFGSDKTKNDLWLVVDLADQEFEEAVILHIRRLLAMHYGPFGSADCDALQRNGLTRHAADSGV